MARLKVGVLISGRGSNLQALIAACAAPDFPGEIALVISNQPDAAGLEYAKAASIAARVISHHEHPNRDGFDAVLDKALRGADIELVCLAGFMRVLGNDFVTAWRDRAINIHPSLLPAFPGLDTHRRALAAGVRIAGCTVHFVRPTVDAGPIIIQAAVTVLGNDTETSLAARILTVEHRIYPLALRLIAEGRVTIRGERVEIARPGETPPALIYPGG